MKAPQVLKTRRGRIGVAVAAGGLLALVAIARRGSSSTGDEAPTAAQATGPGVDPWALESGVQSGGMYDFGGGTFSPDTEGAIVDMLSQIRNALVAPNAPAVPPPAATPSNPRPTPTPQRPGQGQPPKPGNGQGDMGRGTYKDPNGVVRYVGSGDIVPPGKLPKPASQGGTSAKTYTDANGVVRYVGSGEPVGGGGAARPTPGTQLPSGGHPPSGRPTPNKPPSGVKPRPRPAAPTPAPGKPTSWAKPKPPAPKTPTTKAKTYKDAAGNIRQIGTGKMVRKAR